MIRSNFWYDKLIFLKSFSFRKASNMLLVYFSFYFTAIFKKKMAIGKPFTFSVEPTTSCNLGCPECPSGLKAFTRPTGFIDSATFDLFLAKTYRELSFLYFYFQGEPYMHPAFFDLVKKATAKNVYSITSTNAHYLSERKAEETIQSGLKRLIISLDGTTEETYQQYRIGGKLSKVIEGTKNIIAAKKKLKSKTPYVVFQFLVVRHNEHQIADAKALAMALGVDEIVFKSAQIYDYKNDQHLIPLTTKYSRYKQLPSGEYVIKNDLKNRCWKMWHSAVMTWDGTIVPCCFDKDAQYKMGNILEADFAAIWHGEKYNSFRKKLLQERENIDICKNCSEGLNVFEK